jgi:uncharacterized Ntn-hydrolase superfamily protein
MNESIAVAKEADAKKGFSSARRNDKSIQRVRDESERQLNSLGGVIGNIRRDGAKPSAESIATELGSRSAAERAPALLALQQTHGNRYVQRVVAGIQAKLVVGQPGDKYEHEADRVADEVMRMPEPQMQRQEEEEEIQAKPLAEETTPLVQRQVEEEEEEEEEPIQTKNILDQTPEVTSDLEARIQTLKGGGQPLPESVRAYFEPRFGYDLRRVRVHTDTQAGETARALNAQAFAFGQNIVFEARQYTPDTPSGKRLLAHELTHVVQQGGTHVSRKPAETREAVATERHLKKEFAYKCTCKDFWVLFRSAELQKWLRDYQREIGFEFDVMHVWLKLAEHLDLLDKWHGLPERAVLNESYRYSIDVTLYRTGVVGPIAVKLISPHIEKKKPTEIEPVGAEVSPTGEKAGAEGLTNEEKFDAVKDTFSETEKIFHVAQKVLPSKEARDKAKEIADALGKANKLIDSVDTGITLYRTVDAFLRLDKYDPKDNPEGFAKAAGEVLANVGKIMAMSKVPGISWIGGLLSNAGSFFVDMIPKFKPHGGKQWEEIGKEVPGFPSR